MDAVDSGTVPLAAGSPSESDRAKALAGARHIAWLQGDNDSARRWCEETILIARPLDDRHLLSTTPGGTHGLLTPRERQIAARLARGLSNRQLAASLVITEQTAETRVKRILGKLGLHSRHQVADWAMRAGLATH